MRFLSRVRSALRSWFLSRRVEREVDDELRFALDELTARHVARGLPREAAERAARLELGRVDTIREDVRARGLTHLAETLARDASQAARGLLRTPALTVLVVVILAVGIGAATAIFSVVNALLLEPLPYRDAHQLVFVWQDLTSAGYPRAPLAGPELQDLRDRSTRFSAFGGIWANTAALTDGDEPEQLRIGRVTTNFFDVLGADAFLGRTFKDGDDAQDGAPSILLSGPLWKRRYGGDLSIVGRRILVDGRPTTVVGVMPESFRLLLPADSAIPDDQQAWMLLGRNFARNPRQQQYIRVVGRLKPGVPLHEGQQEISSIARQLQREFTEYDGDGPVFYGVGLQADATREVRPALLALFGAVCLLLTIGCVNVAGLLVTRAAARHHETAVRLAIGAGRGRLFRQCLTEGLLLSLAGGAAGILVARAMLALLLSARPDTLSRLDLTQLDGRVLACALAVSFIWGVLFSFAPFAQVFRTNVAGILQGNRRSTVGWTGYRVRASLVVAQVAISCVLMVTAGLMARGFYELQRVDFGFVDDGVMTFKVSLPFGRYRGLQAIATFSQQLREQLGAIPGVKGVGAVSHLPYDTVPNWGTPYLPEPITDTGATSLADARAVTPGYFEAVGAELVEGRWFTEADTFRSVPVAIVDSLFAQRTWPGQSALGKRVKADPATSGVASVPVAIVGVVKHLRHREITRDLREQMYFPAQQSLRNPMAYAVRVDGDPASIVPAVRQVFARLDPALPIYDVRPLTTYTEAATAVRRFTLVLALAFAASALLLAGVGIYGVTAYTAAQRRQEFGLRFALGARTEQVAALVLKDAAWLTGAGILLGCLGGAGAAALIRSQLYRVSAVDPLTYVAGVAIVLAAAFVASAHPAYRASRTDPLASLRTE